MGIPGRKMPLKIIALEKGPEWETPGMEDESAMAREAPGLSKSLIHSEILPLSKDGLETNWGQVGQAEAEAEPVRVVEDVTREFQVSFERFMRY